MGGYIPFNTALNARVGGPSLGLTDQSGTALSPQGIPVQVSPADFQFPPLYPAPLAQMFPPPKAKVVTVYAAFLH